MPHTFNQTSPQNAPLPAHNLYLCHSLSCVTALQVACPILLSLLLSLCFSSFSIFCSLSSLPLLSGSIKKKIDPFSMCLFVSKSKHPKNPASSRKYALSICECGSGMQRSRGDGLVDRRDLGDSTHLRRLRLRHRVGLVE